LCRRVVAGGYSVGRIYSMGGDGVECVIVGDGGRGGKCVVTVVKYYAVGTDSASSGRS
jgi:hypothetical protein